MAETTIWQARQVGYKLLCGRKDPDGRYICVGHLGSAGHSSRGWFLAPPPGYVQLPNVTPTTFVLTRHSAMKAKGRPPGFRRKLQTSDLGPIVPAHPTPPPWRIACPKCNVMAEVGVLS